MADHPGRPPFRCLRSAARSGDEGMTAVGIRLAVVEPRISAAVFFSQGFVPDSPREQARQVTIPLQFLLQWDDEGMQHRGVMDILDADEVVIGQTPAPIPVVTDNGSAFKTAVFTQAFTGEDPLLRHVRTRGPVPQTNGVIERLFGTLKYDHLYQAPIGDGDALAVEINRYRHMYNTIRPRRALADRTPRSAYLASGLG
jgi:Integrase core domain